MNCVSCGQPFQWFSGNTGDYRCMTCRDKYGSPLYSKPIPQMDIVATDSSFVAEPAPVKSADEIFEDLVRRLPTEYQQALGPVLTAILKSSAQTIHEESQKLYDVFTLHLREK